MSEPQVIASIVAFLIPLVFAGGGMVAASLVDEHVYGRRLLYFMPAIAAWAPVLPLLYVVHAKAIGSVLGAVLVCLLVWRGYRSEARPSRKQWRPG